MTLHCACWRCRGLAWNDGTLHGGAAVWAPDTTTWASGADTRSCNVDHGGGPCSWNPDPLRAPGTDTDPGCACEGCRPDDDAHPEAVIAWIAIALLAWVVVGVIVWMVVRRG